MKNSVRYELLRGGSFVFVLNSIGKILSVGSKMLLSNFLGVFIFGIYELILSIARLLSISAQGGLHQTIVHFLSVYRINENWSGSYASYKYGLKLVFAGTIIISGVLLIYQNYIHNILFEESQPVIYVIMIAVLLPLFAFNNFCAYTLRGLKKYAEQAFYFNVAYPICLILAIGILMILFPDSLILVNILKIVAVIFVLIVVFILLRLIFIFRRKTDGVKKYTDSGKMIRYTIPVWFNTLLTSGMNQIDRPMIGILSSVSQVGLYGASFAVSFFIRFIPTSFTPIFQPLITESFAKNDQSRMSELYNTVITWSAYIVIPIFGGIICFGDVILHLFGEEFRAAYPVLIVLAVAEIVNTLSGPAGNFLIMAEKQVTSSRILFLGFIVGITLNFLLIPQFGALGAAVGTGLAVVFVNILRVLKVVQYFNIKTKFTIPIKLLVLFAPLVGFIRYLSFNLIIWKVWLILLFLPLAIVLIFIGMAKEDRIRIFKIFSR